MSSLSSHRAPPDLANSLMRGMRVLRGFGIAECEGAVVPDSWPNGTAKHSHSCYLSVMVDDEVTPASADVLEGLGWFSEQDGLYWLVMLS